MTLSHYILTSFYVDNQGTGCLPGEGWLRNRIPIFERYCLPSVLNQTNRNFTWLVYCDSASPAWLRDYFNALNVINLETVWIDGRIDGSAVRESIQERCGQRVLTTRLDNDDVLALDFVERLQAAAMRQTCVGINFTHGLQATPVGLLWTRAKGSAFVSIVDSQGATSRTVFDFDHQLVGRDLPLVQLGGAPGWLQVVHGENVLNRAHGIPVGRRRFQVRFPSVQYCPPLDPSGYLAEVRPFSRALGALARRMRQSAMS